MEKGGKSVKRVKRVNNVNKDEKGEKGEKGENCEKGEQSSGKRKVPASAKFRQAQSSGLNSRLEVKAWTQGLDSRLELKQFQETQQGTQQRNRLFSDFLQYLPGPNLTKFKILNEIR